MHEHLRQWWKWRKR